MPSTPWVESSPTTASIRSSGTSTVSWFQDMEAEPSTKDFFYALQNLFLYGLVFSVNGRGKLSQQVLLLARQLVWNDDIERHEEIPASRPTALGNTASFDAEG